MAPADLKQHLQAYGQQHVLAFWDQLSADQQAELRRQIEAIDLPLIDSLYNGEVDQPL